MTSPGAKRPTGTKHHPSLGLPASSVSSMFPNAAQLIRYRLPVAQPTPRNNPARQIARVALPTANVVTEADHGLLWCPCKIDGSHDNATLRARGANSQIGGPSDCLAADEAREKQGPFGVWIERTYPGGLPRRSGRVHAGTIAQLTVHRRLGTDAAISLDCSFG
jgi:hypothetical protein